MEIKSVHFETFKSLYDVRSNFGHLTVLTGPNGAGKSNFVDALNFLAEVYEDGLEFAISRAGGYDNIAHRRTRRAKRPISFSVEIEVTRDDFMDSEIGPLFLPGFARQLPSDFRVTYRHSFSFSTSTQKTRADFRVSHDEVAVLDRTGHLIFRQIKVGTNVETWSSDDPISKELFSPYSDPEWIKYRSARVTRGTQLMTEEFDYPNIFWLVRRAIAGLRVFQLSPYQVRSAGVSTPNATLQRHGENLPGAADHLMRTDSEAWDKVVQAMRTIMPDLESIDIKHTDDRRLVLVFRESGLERPWSTSEVSDGTIQALALFITLFDRRSPVLAIEEPENSVHPWILRQFLELCGSSLSKQVLMTTHSPVLLSSVLASNVSLVSMRDGRTVVEPLLAADPHMAEALLTGQLSVFEYYDSGLLEGSMPRGLSSLDLTEEDDEDRSRD